MSSGGVSANNSVTAHRPSLSNGTEMPTFTAYTPQRHAPSAPASANGSFTSQRRMSFDGKTSLSAKNLVRCHVKSFLGNRCVYSVHALLKRWSCVSPYFPLSLEVSHYLCTVI